MQRKHWIDRPIDDHQQPVSLHLKHDTIWCGDPKKLQHVATYVVIEIAPGGDRNGAAGLHDFPEFRVVLLNESLALAIVTNSPTAFLSRLDGDDAGHLAEAVKRNVDAIRRDIRLHLVSVISPEMNMRWLGMFLGFALGNHHMIEQIVKEIGVHLFAYELCVEVEGLANGFKESPSRFFGQGKTYRDGRALDSEGEQAENDNAQKHSGSRARRQAPLVILNALSCTCEKQDEQAGCNSSA